MRALLHILAIIPKHGCLLQLPLRLQLKLRQNRLDVSVRILDVQRPALTTRLLLAAPHEMRGHNGVALVTQVVPIRLNVTRQILPESRHVVGTRLNRIPERIAARVRILELIRDVGVLQLVLAVQKPIRGTVIGTIVIARCILDRVVILLGITVPNFLLRLLAPDVASSNIGANSTSVTCVNCQRRHTHRIRDTHL